METVAIEWISSMEIEPRDVVQFIQKLKDIPENAVCEVGSIFSRPCHLRGGNQDEHRIRNEVHLCCEPNVTAFLCKKFSKQTQHVTSGEVIHVRCKRVYPVLGKMLAAHSDISALHGSDSSRNPTNDPSDDAPSTSNADYVALPIDKVITLVDLLGDQVVDAQEVYEFFADPDACGPQRMTMLGLSKALAKLHENTACHTEVSVQARSSSIKKNRKKSSMVLGGGTNVTVDNLRHLMSRLIASQNVGVRRLPSATTMPFLSYTDFLACYVAVLARLHSSS